MRDQWGMSNVLTVSLQATIYSLHDRGWSRRRIARELGIDRETVIAAITQHIPDKSFQLVRYYGWYSNKMRGRRAKQADEEAQAEGDAVEVIDVSAHEPRRIPSKKWRELIKKVWEADPLRCPKCSREMRIVSLIDEEDVIERILGRLGLWQEGVRVHCGTDPPGETTLDPWLADPFPDYDTEPVVAFYAS
jgi:hypothetical protein